MVRGHLFQQNSVSAVAGLLPRCLECSEPEQVSMEDTAGCKRVFITNVKGTFFGMSESEEASKRR